MEDILHYETVTPLLRRVLVELMNEKLFAPFLLVGGTNLSLRFGHRRSDDIDLFTDAEYGSINFREIEEFLKQRFSYYESNDASSIVGFGRGYYVGDSENEVVKLDLMYADPFINEADEIDGIRMASVDDIIAMKVDVVSRGGRKKDFWDLHLLSETYTIEDMLQLHKKRYEWTHHADDIRRKFLDFSVANDDFDPVCLLGKMWDIIRLDFVDLLEQ